mgnify:CR=1 FL=1
MAIIKSIPSQRIIYGRILNTSEVSIVSESDYRTQGENCIIVKDIPHSTIILDSSNCNLQVGSIGHISPVSKYIKSYVSVVFFKKETESET